MAKMDREALKKMTELRTESVSDWMGMMSSGESIITRELTVVGLDDGVVATWSSVVVPIVNYIEDRIYQVFLFSLVDIDIINKSKRKRKEPVGRKTSGAAATPHHLSDKGNTNEIRALSFPSLQRLRVDGGLLKSVAVKSREKLQVDKPISTAVAPLFIRRPAISFAYGLWM